MSRVLVKNFTALDFLKNEVVDHIPHAYSAAMKKKSEIVSIDNWIFNLIIGGMLPC